MVAMAQPWKHPKTGVYWLRRAVPAELRGRLIADGKLLGREVKRSLRTKDPAVAKAIFQRETQQVDDLFRRLRGRASVTTTTTTTTTTEAPAPAARPTTEALEAMAWAIYLRERRAEERRYHANPRPLDELRAADLFAVEEWEAGLDDGTWAPETIGYTARELHARGLDLPRNDPRFDQALRLVARARICAGQALTATVAGDYSYKPSIPERVAPAAPVPDTGELISELFTAWNDERKPSAKTTADFSRGIRRFTELHGDVPAASITKAHVRKFKNELRRLPRVLTGPRRDMTLPDLLAALENEPPAETVSAAVVNKDIGSLSAVLSWAAKQGHFDHVADWSNPCAGLKIEARATADEKRLPYGPGDLTAIFTSPVFASGERPRAGGGEAAKWLPLLALFTGARLEELGQAMVSDIRKEGGVVFLDLNTLDEGKTLKTATSRRRVPLHPMLPELGFLAYVDTLPRGGRLFPDLKPDQHEQLTGNFSKWWGRYARGLGITDRRKVFHSFRHSFKDACRAAGIEEAVHDALTGHAGGGVGRTYGLGYPLPVLADAVKKLTFPGFPADAFKVGIFG